VDRQASVIAVGPADENKAIVPIWARPSGINAPDAPATQNVSNQLDSGEPCFVAAPLDLSEQYFRDAGLPGALDILGIDSIKLEEPTTSHPEHLNYTLTLPDLSLQCQWIYVSFFL
jgi:hypothetical protein